jgi:hypothetical protein
MHLLNLILWTLLSFSSSPNSAPEPLIKEAMVISRSTKIADFYNDLSTKNLDIQAFTNAIEGIEKYHPSRPYLAIADFSKPSSEKRLYIIDLQSKKLILRTWVAHGKNSGENIAVNFSNKQESYMSSTGFYRVNEPIQSPKHGQALLLEGLEKGVNDNARKREIIIHGADYVSGEFIKRHGRLGRSYGCPAVSRDDMKQVAEYLANGALLYIYSPLKK